MIARIATFAAILVVSAVPCRAQVGPLVSKTVWRPKTPAPANLETGPWESMPIRKVDTAASPFLKSKSLVEIEERIPPEHIYRNVERPGEWAHETTHGINSRLRNEIGAGVGVYYVLGKQAWVLKYPNTKLSRVAQRVSPRDRGEVFHTYLIAPSQPQPQNMPGMIVEGWENEPFFILDEWVAYLAGATVMQELYGSQTSIPIPNQPGYSDSVVDTKRATEFVPYVDALLRAIEEDDPNYADMDKLKQFVGLNMERLAKLTELHPQPNFQTIQNVFYQRWGNCGRHPQQQWQQWQPSPQVRPAQPIARPAQPAPASTLAPIPDKPVQPPAVAQPVVKGCDCGDMKTCGCDPGLAATVAELSRDLKEIKQDVTQIKAQVSTIGSRVTSLETREYPIPDIDAMVDEAVKNIKPCECNSEDDAATRPGQPAYFDIKPHRRK